VIGRQFDQLREFQARRLDGIDRLLRRDPQLGPGSARFAQNRRCLARVFAEIAFVLTVGAKSPIKSVAELTAYLKSRQLPLSDDSKATAARLQVDIVQWGPLVKAAKIGPQ
jgi:hypothetical protein